MAIYRGIGGGGDANTNVEINELAAITQQALDAATSATTNATTATTQAATATTAATNASASAASAATSASTASSQATSASTSATSAATSATNAADSATAAATSASEAATSASNAAAAARTSISVTGAGTYDSTTGVINIQGGVTSVAGRTGAVTLSKTDVGLASVENKSSATILGELTSANVTTALGFTPYNATNPNGYITAASSITGNAATATKLATARNINGVAFDGTVDVTIPGGAKGGGTNAVFFENDQSVTANYTLTTGKNAMTAGPITINNGVVVTIPAGSVWTVV